MYAVHDVHDVPAIKKLTTQDRDGGTFWPRYQLFFLGQHCLLKENMEPLVVSFLFLLSFLNQIRSSRCFSDQFDPDVKQDRPQVDTFQFRSIFFQ